MSRFTIEQCKCLESQALTHTREHQNKLFDKWNEDMRDWLWELKKTKMTYLLLGCFWYQIGQFTAIVLHNI